MRTTLERGLERGWLGGPLPGFASRPWEMVAARGLARPLRVPSHAQVVTVGGATLGGSWKTPLAVACTRRWAEGGVDVALVGHGYRARPGCARRVEPGDAVGIVGDEALACARQVADLPSARVVVGPTRQKSFDLAVAHADRVVIDGALQLGPRRAWLALLAVDATAPWGAGACPPRGDLRAPIAALIAACDRVVAVGNGDLDESLLGLPKPLHRARTSLVRARCGEQVLGMGDLRSLRVGLWTSLARPSRLVDALAQVGVLPAVTLAGSDHAGPSLRQREQARTVGRAAGVDVWLCTTKCQVHVAVGNCERAELGGRPLFALELETRLDAALAAELVTEPMP